MQLKIGLLLMSIWALCQFEQIKALSELTWKLLLLPSQRPGWRKGYGRHGLEREARTLLKSHQGGWKRTFSTSLVTQDQEAFVQSEAKLKNHASPVPPCCLCPDSHDRPDAICPPIVLAYIACNGVVKKHQDLPERECYHANTRRSLPLQ